MSVYLEIAENRNLGQASYSQVIVKSLQNKGEECSFRMKGPSKRAGLSQKSTEVNWESHGLWVLFGWAVVGGGARNLPSSCWVKSG